MSALPFAFVRRNKGSENRASEGVQRQTTRKRVTQKWIEVRNPNQEKAKIGETHDAKNPEPTRRKEIEAIWADDQRDRLQRSLLV
ncbi:hypothetical protein PIB30_029945 [Stylosanthes scabra]|uniref:Uncharacterized protein n=1 Tax=Stylosanthes scabra TaxID=79078 RepID=A0ABU6VAB5_9FABA|nr:hypothetical protein [Stylosanthes scabra]